MGKEIRVIVRLSPERERYVRRCVEGGQYATAELAVDAALGLLEERGPTSPLGRAVRVGLEQALAERASYITSEEIRRRAFRRRTPR